MYNARDFTFRIRIIRDRQEQMCNDGCRVANLQLQSGVLANVLRCYRDLGASSCLLMHLSFTPSYPSPFSLYLPCPYVAPGVYYIEHALRFRMCVRNIRESTFLATDNGPFFRNAIAAKYKYFVNCLSIN